MKHVLRFDQIVESTQRNAIVLIKGKPKKGKRHLYAAHVLGSIEIRPGAELMFLSDVFYRIEDSGNRLTGVRIAWENEEALKDSLNLKSPGKISVVKNNNKTPFHWETTRHTHLRDALDSIEGKIDTSDYDL